MLLADISRLSDGSMLDKREIADRDKNGYIDRARGIFVDLRFDAPSRSLHYRLRPPESPAAQHESMESRDHYRDVRDVLDHGPRYSRLHQSARAGSPGYRLWPTRRRGEAARESSRHRADVALHARLF